MGVFMRNSYQAAIGRALQSEIDSGGVVSCAPDGQTVIQFPNHFKIGSGLVWAENRGQFKGSISECICTLTAEHGPGAGLPALRALLAVAYIARTLAATRGDA